MQVAFPVLVENRKHCVGKCDGSHCWGFVGGGWGILRKHRLFCLACAKQAYLCFSKMPLPPLTNPPKCGPSHFPTHCGPNSDTTENTNLSCQDAQGMTKIINDVTLGQLRKKPQSRRQMNDNKYIWEGTHTISKHRLRLQKRTGRMLLMSLYESPSQICAVQFRLFGDESTEQAHSQAFDFMKKIAISYSEGKLELRNLYKERNRLLTAMGLGPEAKLQSVDHKAEAPKEDPEMPESNPEEGEEDDESEKEGDESPEEEAEEESAEEQTRDTG